MVAESSPASAANVSPLVFRPASRTTVGEPSPAQVIARPGSSVAEVCGSGWGSGWAAGVEESPLLHAVASRKVATTQGPVA